MCDEKSKNGKNYKRGEDMTMTAEKLTELREAMKAVNKGIPVLNAGKEGAIELDSKNPLHRKWYEGR